MTILDPCTTDIRPLLMSFIKANIGDIAYYSSIILVSNYS